MTLFRRMPPWAVRAGWFVLFWLGGVLAVGSLATLLRLWLKA